MINDKKDRRFRLQAGGGSFIAAGRLRHHGRGRGRAGNRSGTGILRHGTGKPRPDAPAHGRDRAAGTGGASDGPVPGMKEHLPANTTAPP
ncbi:hypothetical protein, partial [Arthrobacter sp. H14]|uniref:hypothetical protein n=1 Tax=Arthrobacter sp. H14 TaxID=1312959 RepID=UPI00055DA754